MDVIDVLDPHAVEFGFDDIEKTAVKPLNEENGGMVRLSHDADSPLLQNMETSQFSPRTLKIGLARSPLWAIPLEINPKQPF